MLQPGLAGNSIEAPWRRNGGHGGPLRLDSGRAHRDELELAQQRLLGLRRVLGRARVVSLLACKAVLSVDQLRVGGVVSRAWAVLSVEHVRLAATAHQCRPHARRRHARETYRAHRARQAGYAIAGHQNSLPTQTGHRS
eukprot:COSAG01_NODE_2607_length_7390_cov_77.965574_11_plen_138_part_01